jgi:crotonobetainyl-CoA:carnitine CoA-transferase CaiB-like acyl-CoA transferase
VIVIAKCAWRPCADRAPCYGANGREILAEFSFSDDEIDRLAASGVLVEQRRR